MTSPLAVAFVSRRLVVLGAGGHGTVVAEAAAAAGHTVVGFLDDAPGAGGTSLVGMPIIGHIGSLDQLPTGIDGALLGIGDNAVRARLLACTALNGIDLVTVIHPRAWVSPSASLGRGCVIVAGAVVNARSSLGDGCIINTCATVDHDCRLGACVHIAPGAHLAGGVQADAGAYIGIGANVIEGLTIGRGALVAAGAAVVRDVPDGGRVAGVPARPMRSP